MGFKDKLLPLKRLIKDQHILIPITYAYENKQIIRVVRHFSRESAIGLSALIGVALNLILPQVKEKGERTKDFVSASDENYFFCRIIAFVAF